MAEESLYLSVKLKKELFKIVIIYLKNTYKSKDMLNKLLYKLKIR